MSKQMSHKDWVSPAETTPTAITPEMAQAAGPETLQGPHYDFPEAAIVPVSVTPMELLQAAMTQGA